MSGLFNSLVSNTANNILMISKLKIRKRIAPIFLVNGISATVIIPRDLAKKYKIDQPCHVTIEDTRNGLLIRKAEISD
jgi:hypothetical protein